MWRAPGYQKDLYPHVYTVPEHITKIKIPIIPFGLGWNGKPVYRPDKFSFNDASRSILGYIHKNAKQRAVVMYSPKKHFG